MHSKQICNNYKSEMNTKSKSRKRLEKCGIKPSLQRMAVMDYLLEHKMHPTADMIFSSLQPSIPTLSKTTVYNTVKLLAENGAILAINIDEKNQRFDGDISQHAHFLCKICGKIYDMPIAGLQISHSENCTENFLITETQIYYKGFCKKCK